MAELQHLTGVFGEMELIFMPGITVVAVYYIVLK
jgi:hypothetical protein